MILVLRIYNNILYIIIILDPKNNNNNIDNYNIRSQRTIIILLPKNITLVTDLKMFIIANLIMISMLQKNFYNS